MTPPAGPDHLILCGSGDALGILVFIVVVIISVISSALESRKKKQQVKEAQQRRASAPQGSRPQAGGQPTSIEDFLRELSRQSQGQGTPAAPPPAATPAGIPDADTTPDIDTQQRQRAEARRREYEARQRESAPRREEEARVLAQQRKLQEAMRQRESARETAEHDLAAAGGVKRVVDVRRPPSAGEHRAAAGMKIDLRQAVIFREILGPPLALRHNDDLDLPW